MPDDGVQHLTPRLLQVLRLLADGQTATAIGRRLHVSESTAANHVLRLRRLLGASDRANAVAIGYQLGLLHVGVDNGTPACRCAVPPTVNLPVRLHELLRRVARGETVDEVAVGMGVARGTVSVHAQRLYRGLGARSQAHAVALGYETGLLRYGDSKPVGRVRRVS